MLFRSSSWQWDFDDDTTGDGEIIKHSYTDGGLYTVTLTVTDDVGDTDTDSITVQIDVTNTDPMKPLVNGITKGHQNIEYVYTAVSTDSDNDSLCYIFDWGDNSGIITTDYINSGTVTEQTHAWNSAGEYTISVTANDDKTYSESTQLTILIDVLYVGDIGYLIDDNSDNIYDSFYINVTGVEIAVEYQDDGTYLIDIDGDDKWDYIYDHVAGVSVYQNDDEEERTPGFEIIIAISAIAIFLFWKRKKIVDKY